jgi:hypothetical protein
MPGRGAALALVLESVAAVQNVGAPNAPGNITVTVSPNHASVRWLHSMHGGGLPTHYVVKYQAKAHTEVLWHPDWVGIGSEIIELQSLYPGRTYALRVAAVNKQGRAWSDAVLFRTLSSIHCIESQEWLPLIDEADQRRVCTEERRTTVKSNDPDARGECSQGVTEYLFAGVAAAGTIALVLFALLSRHPGVRRLYLRDEEDAEEEEYDDEEIVPTPQRGPCTQNTTLDGAAEVQAEEISTDSPAAHPPSSARGHAVQAQPWPPGDPSSQLSHPQYSEPFARARAKGECSATVASPHPRPHPGLHLQPGSPPAGAASRSTSSLTDRSDS